MKIRNKVAIPTTIVEELEGKLIIKARQNINGETPINAEEEQANAKPLVLMEIQKVFNATIAISMDTMHQIVGVNLEIGTCILVS